MTRKESCPTYRARAVEAAPAVGGSARRGGCGALRDPAKTSQLNIGRSKWEWTDGSTDLIIYRYLGGHTYPPPAFYGTSYPIPVFDGTIALLGRCPKKDSEMNRSRTGKSRPPVEVVMSKGLDL